MATLKTLNPTLADVAARTASDGSIITDLVEMLHETNDVLTDMTFIEANSTTQHKTTVRTGLPTATWRKLYGGVQASKSSSATVSDSMGMLQSYAVVDKDLADLNGNSASWRLSEESAFVEAMNQEMAETLWYGDTTHTPEKFTGLAARYSQKNAPNGRNIIDAGGTNADNTSIYLVVWSPNTCHGIYPKGFKAGLEKHDLGEQSVRADDGSGEYQAYKSLYKWNMGLTLRDWRYVVRIANIDVTKLESGTGADLLKLMVKATHRIPNLRRGRAAFYANREVHEALDVQSLDRKGLALKTHELEGKVWSTFRGIPLRTSDALLSTESPVV